MFNITKQLKKQFTSFMVNNFNEASFNADMDQSLKNDETIDINEISKLLKKYPREKIQDEVNNKGLILGEGAFEKLFDEYDNIIEDTQDQTSNLNEDYTQAGDNYETVNTQTTEQFSDNGTINTIEKVGDIENVNKNSAIELLAKHSPSEIKNTIIEIKSEIESKRLESGDFTPVNVGSIIREKFGYSPDGLFGIFELTELLDLINLAEQNQAEISTASGIEKLQVMIDFNFDGKLTNKFSYYLKELQVFDAIIDRPENINNFYDNLGFSGGEAEFNQIINKNYFEARKIVKTSIGILMNIKGKNNGAKANALFQKDGVKNLYQNEAKTFNETNDTQTLSIIEQEMDNNPKFQQLKETNLSVYNKAKLSYAAVLGEVNGMGISYDTKEVTRGLISNTSFAMTDKGPAIVINKNIDLGNGHSLNVGAANVTAYINANVLLQEGHIQETEDIFTTDLTGNPDISFNVGTNTMGIAHAGVGFSKVDGKTTKGIEEQVAYIKNGGGSKDANVKRITNLVGDINKVNDAAGDHARVILNESREGINVTGGAFGIAEHAGILYPSLGIMGNSITNNWAQVHEGTGINSTTTTRTETFTSTFDEFDYQTELSDDVKSALDNINSKFDANTRNIKGAKQILNLENSLDERLEGVKILAKNTPKDFPLMALYKLAKKGNEIDKEFVVSHITSLLSKSHEANLNKSINDVISRDRHRLNSFEQIELNNLGTSLKPYAESFHETQKELSPSGKQQITTLSGVMALDVKATLVGGKRVSNGIQAITDSVNVIADDSGIAIQIPVSEEDKNTILSNALGENWINNHDISNVNVSFVKIEGYDNGVIIEGLDTQEYKTFVENNKNYDLGVAGLETTEITGGIGFVGKIDTNKKTKPKVTEEPEEPDTTPVDEEVPEEPQEPEEPCEVEPEPTPEPEEPCEVPEYEEPENNPDPIEEIPEYEEPEVTTTPVAPEVIETPDVPEYETPDIVEVPEYEEPKVTTTPVAPDIPEYEDYNIVEKPEYINADTNPVNDTTNIDIDIPQPTIDDTSTTTKQDNIGDWNF